MSAHVYLAAGTNYQPLYVGQTTDPTRRLDQHRRASEWWPHRVWVGVSPAMSRDQAAADEGWLIRTLKPRYNIQQPDAPGPTCTYQTYQLLADYMRHRTEHRRVRGLFTQIAHGQRPPANAANWTITVATPDPLHLAKRIEERVPLRAVTPTDARLFVNQERRRRGLDGMACRGAEMCAAGADKEGFQTIWEWIESVAPTQGASSGDEDSPA